jgi:hypothetical protein
MITSYCLSNIVREIKSRRKRCAGRIAQIEETSVEENFGDRDTDGKIMLKVDLEEVVYDDMN